MNETLKRVYELLELKCELVDYEDRKYFTLTRNGKRLGYYAPSEEVAWQFGASFRELRDPLEDVMVTERFSVEFFQNEFGYGAALTDWDIEDEDAWVEVVQPFATRAEAVAALFIKACEAGLVDPKAVVLP